MPTKMIIRLGCAFAVMLFATSANAQSTLDLRPYWNGLSPMAKVQGHTLFEVIASWGERTAEPILQPADYLPTTRWSTATAVELRETVLLLGTVHYGDALFFTECRTRGCSLSNPDIEWIVYNEGLYFYLSIAQKDYAHNNIEWCTYKVGVNGPLTGWGYGQWRCYYGTVGDMRLPSGSPQMMTDQMLRSIDYYSSHAN